MKKIIYSIVAAFILSVSLALIFPTWFLNGDARWTFLSDTARMDISFDGNLKNGRVKVEGGDTRITQPTWLSNESYQGTVVEFPVSYWRKSYHVKLTPQADEWGEDAAFVIKFRGEDFKHEGKRRPAWVTFQNISFNGQSVAAERIVCHDQPFLLKYPHHSSGITLTLGVHKPLTRADISFVNLLVVFFACLLLSRLLLVPLQRAVSRGLDSFYGKDIIKVLSEGYSHIDLVYRRSFWIIFGVLCVAFGFHVIWFMWGNHDWAHLDRAHRWTEHAWEGRYMASSVKTLLSNGVYLPLILDVISYATLALNAVLLCRYWRLKKRVAYFVLCGLVLTAQPFTLSMMYFVTMTPEVFIGVTCVLVALILSESIPSGGGGYCIERCTCQSLPLF